MGKEWLYHLGSKSSSTSNRSSGKTSSSRGELRDSTSSSTSFSGCMNAIFQLFDLHKYFHFSNLHPQQPPSSSSSSFNPPDDFFLPQLQPPPIHLKGVEAPRNSLEMEDTRFMGAPTSISSDSTMKQQDTLEIPMGDIQIKTSGHTRSSRKTTDLHDISSSECVYRSSSSSNSPAGTTPTLVARLMGLDHLPETSSPRPSSSSSVSNLSSSKSQLQQVQNPRKKQKNDHVMTGSRSLPNTPRTSSARRSDVVDQRFSLQINKENNNNELATSQEFEFSKFLTTKIAAAADRSKGDENMSPGHYAKQIVKQFKENVSRRVGRDITNTVENNRSEQRRDQHVVLLKSKKPPLSNIGDCHDHDQFAANYSCSPRLKFLEIKNKTSHSPKLSTSPLSPFTQTAQSKSATVETSKPKDKAQSIPLKEEQQQIITQQSSSQKCNKIDSGKVYGARRPSVRSKKEESFVRSSSATSSTRANANHLSEKKKCKQTPLSNVSTILNSVKKDPSPPASRLPQQQEKRKQYDESSKVFDDTLLSKSSRELSSCSSQSYKQEANSIITVTDINSNGGTSTTVSAEVVEYISRILECTGIHEFTPVSFTKWYSPSHPLDSSLFRNLHFRHPKLELNKEKLVFDVVDELLAEILRPYMNLKPWVNWIARNDHQILILMFGWQLIDTLYARIRSFPSGDCRTLEDIDAVVEKDLGSGRGRAAAAASLALAFEEEGDGIVIEIEGDILDTLVREMVVAMLVFGVRTYTVEKKYERKNRI